MLSLVSLILLTGCLTTRYTDPNLNIVPEFKEADGTGKTMQIVIEDSENIFISTTRGLMSDARSGDPRAYFQELFEKYFDWHMRDISSLKKVEFYTPEDKREYDYTLYISYIGFYPYYIMGTSAPAAGPGGLTIGIGKSYIEDVGFNYDLIYRIEDNETDEVLMFCWIDHELDYIEKAFSFNGYEDGIDDDELEKKKFKSSEKPSKVTDESHTISKQDIEPIFDYTNWYVKLKDNGELRIQRQGVPAKKFKYDSSHVFNKKQWKKGIRKLARKVILNTPFYSREEEEKNENKYYNFRSKTDFHKKPSLF